ncbi:MAG: hypothetical protein P1Q69_20535, partial [Candidatus Thorarchaeota archaeon]|nr:hypothetical protein [Candidatus Thorarchaeota archaeon]
MTVEKMKFMSEAEFFHQDLNLVAVTEDDDFAAFCMYRLDPLTKIAELEIRGEHPAFDHLSIEAVLLTGGLRRVRDYQPDRICAVEIDVSEPDNQTVHCKLHNLGHQSEVLPE